MDIQRLEEDWDLAWRELEEELYAHGLLQSGEGDCTANENPGLDKN